MNLVNNHPAYSDKFVKKLFPIVALEDAINVPIFIIYTSVDLKKYNEPVDLKDLGTFKFLETRV